MTVLKWLLIVVSVGYVGGLLALFFAQRAVLFPIPTSARTTPPAAGFPEAEEHILTTADGEKVIVWHVPARPGRPVVLYFHGNGDYLAGFFGRFREHHRRRDRGRRIVLSRLCRLERAAERAGIAAGRRGGLCLHGRTLSRGQDRRLGLFARHRRRGGAGGGAAGSGS